MKEILVYRIDDYVSCGGGLYIEYFDSDDFIPNRINELASLYGNKFILEVTGSLHERIYKPVEIVTRYERQ